MEKNQEWKKWIKWFIFAVAVIFAYKSMEDITSVTGFFGYLISTLMPFFIGILIAYILYFPCKSVEKMLEKIKEKHIRKRARGLAVLIVFLIATIIVVVMVNFLFPILSKSVIDLANNFPTYYRNFTEFLQTQPEDSILNSLHIADIVKEIEKIDISGLFSTENLINYIKGAVGFINGIFSAFITLMVSVYALLERRQVLNFIKKISSTFLKQKTCERIGKYFGKTNDIFYKFISSQIIDGIVLGTILSIVMSLMGVKYAVLLGFMIGVFNLIPYVGAIVGIVVALFITLLTGGLPQTIWTGIVVIIIQQIDINFINPKIAGKSLRLSPLLVIFAITIGGAFFGVFGMFIAIPVATVLKIVVTDYLDYKNKNKMKIEENTKNK